MLGVASVHATVVAHAGWVSEKSYETVVVSGSKELAVVGSSNAIDVSAISALGVDSLNVPAEFHGGGCPVNAGSVGSSRCILRAVAGLPEEELVSTAVSPDPLVVLGPVEGHDVGRVSLALTFKGPVTGVVDVDVVVVGSDSKHGLVWGEGHNFIPSFSIGQGMGNIAVVAMVSDGDGTIVL